MDKNDQYAGWALAIASLLSVVAMAHHPSGHDGGSDLNQLVHGAMIVLVLVSLAGFARLAWRLDLDRFGVLLGLIVYAVAAVANVLAATINGFVAPAMANSASDHLLQALWAFNQALAYGAANGIGAAFALWGLALLRTPGFERWAGVGAIIVGALSIGLLAGGLVRMNVSGAFTIYSAQAGFGVLAASVLMRPRASG